jgi:hypothetical protein
MFIEISKSLFSELETSIIHLLTNTEDSMIDLLENIEFLFSEMQMKFFSEVSSSLLNEDLKRNYSNLKIMADNFLFQEKNKLKLMQMRKLFNKKIKRLFFLSSLNFHIFY